MAQAKAGVKTTGSGLKAQGSGKILERGLDGLA